MNRIEIPSLLLSKHSVWDVYYIIQFGFSITRCLRGIKLTGRDIMIIRSLLLTTVSFTENDVPYKNLNPIVITQKMPGTMKMLI